MTAVSNFSGRERLWIIGAQLKIGDMVKVEGTHCVITNTRKMPVSGKKSVVLNTGKTAEFGLRNVVEVWREAKQK